MPRPITATRDFGDTGRYNQLPVIATQMGLSMASERASNSTPAFVAL